MPRSEPADELEMIRQAQAGNKEVFAVLHSRYKKQILGYIRARVPDAEDAEEIAQETWGKVWNDLVLYDADRANGLLRAFVYNRAGWQVLDHYRRAQDRRRFEILRSELMATREADRDQGSSGMEELANVDPAPNPEQSAVSAEVMSRILRTTFGGNSPPHQLLAFGFVKLLDWKPGELVEQRSGTAFETLEPELEETYARFMPQTTGADVKESFTPLREKLRLAFGTVVSDPSTREIYKHLWDVLVGATQFQTYYTSSTAPAENISQWLYAVKRRVLSEMLQGSPA